MSLFHSMNCISDSMPCDCTNSKFKVSASVHDSGAVKYMPSATENHKMLDKTQNCQSQKSLYISKACKYSFIASDYTSPDGQKLLNIKVYQNPPETQKVKNFPSKRSISEYFLSKNTVEKDSQDDVRKENNSLKSCHRSFFKNQISFPSPVELQSTSLNCATTSDTVQLSPKSSFVLQNQKQVNSSDADGCFSGKTENEGKHCHSGILIDKSSNKNYNSNPSVNFRVFDIESLSEVGESYDNTSVENNAHFGVDDSWFIPSAKHTFSGAEISGSASAAQLSIASSFGDSNLPTCKICHTAAKPEDTLISPCRCTGTLRYIHCGCLMKWLEICNKRSRKPPTCELCKYQFHWHKKFKVGQWQFPHCSGQDKILHTVFLLSVLIMIGCAIVTVLCFKQHKGVKTEITHLELTQSEIITLICGALFFLSFFLAMYVEIKARNTIYKLLLKFVYLNQQWYIDEYDRNKENSAIDV